LILLLVIVANTTLYLVFLPRSGLLLYPEYVTREHSVVHCTSTLRSIAVFTNYSVPVVLVILDQSLLEYNSDEQDVPETHFRHIQYNPAADPS
jgi:hypothetical protein